MPILRSRGDEVTASCNELAAGNIVIPRSTFIAAMTVCAFITSISLVFLTISTYRACARLREAKQAKVWGRNSTYNHRISLMRKEIDQGYTRQYSGCLVNIPENPEMGSDSPVELMIEERVWEAPAVPAVASLKDRNGTGTSRKSRISLFFDGSRGLWMPKR